MPDQSISIREMQSDEIELMVDYFVNSDSKFLQGMGVDKDKLPSRENWITKLKSDFEKPIEEKEFYYIIWGIDGKPIDHSNISDINFGKSAKMHLHIWNSTIRQAGLGTKLLAQTIPNYFDIFELKKLICEPFADNPAPNKVLNKIGFKFVKKYHTTPGWLAFIQDVNKYELSVNDFKKRFNLKNQIQ